MRLVKMKEKIRFLQLDDSYKQYDVVADQQASELMQQLAQNRWNFPMTLYFEAYGEKDEILATKSVQVQQVPSENKILTFSLKEGIRRAELPAFMVQIEDVVALNMVFQEFFYVAEQNFFFVLTNMPCIKYEGEHPTVQSLDAEIIMADYDGQGALLITNKLIHI